MTTPTPSGWYTDPENASSQRFWDGQSWTDHRAPGAGAHAAVAVANPVPNNSASGTQSSPATVPQTAKDPWFKKRWVLVAAAGVIGIGIGASASGSTDPTTTSAYKQLSSKLDSAKADVTASQAEAADAKAALGDLPSQQAELAAGQEKLKSDQNALASRESAVATGEKAVAKREKAVGKTEDVIASNTLPGDGLYEVGSDIRAGTYKSQGGSDCYYAILNSSDTSDIADNNNTSGPTTVNVRDGQFLELSGCNDFVLQP